MKAIVQDTYGSADVLRVEEIEKPEISDNDVLVRVHAAGLDPGVWHLMTGLPYLVRIMGYGLRAPKTRVPDFDFAGRIEAVGKVSPVIDRTYPLGEATDAIRYWEHGHGGGRIVITV